MNDRSLRDMVIRLGGRRHGFPRESYFQISASSEIMAILCLAESYQDLKQRIDKIFIGFDLGAEKFFDIVGRKSGLNPKVVVW